MAKNYTLKDLIDDSIRVYTGMIAVWPQYNEEEVINFNAATFNGSYSSNNGTLAFVIDDILYVTPSMSRAYDALSGFFRRFFYVPFSNGDYPKKEKSRWEELCTMQHKLAKEDFIQSCEEYCDKHNIGTLTDEVLSKCFVIPEKGVMVESMKKYRETYYPMLNTTFFDSNAQNLLGKFFCNNGRVAFIYRDGRTIVTRGYWIKSVLEAAGYKEENIFVPFSNSETIVDLFWRSQWERVCRMYKTEYKR